MNILKVKLLSALLKKVLNGENKSLESLFLDYQKNFPNRKREINLISDIVRRLEHKEKVSFQEINKLRSILKKAEVP